MEAKKGPPRLPYRRNRECRCRSECENPGRAGADMQQGPLDRLRKSRNRVADACRGLHSEMKRFLDNLLRCEIERSAGGQACELIKTTCA